MSSTTFRLDGSRGATIAGTSSAPRLRLRAFAGPSSSTHAAQRSTRVQCSSNAHPTDAECSTSTSRAAAPAAVTTRRALLGAAAAALPLLAARPPAATAEPFLSATGGKGVLASEEAFLFKLRQEKEGEARREFEAGISAFEQEAQQTQAGKLCATPFGVDIVGITELVALIGALVGGITARQRKNELERLNEQLRKINLSLRQQARAGTVYAPGLTYAPPSTNGATNGNGASFLDAPPAAAAAAAPAAAATATLTLPKPAPATPAPPVPVVAPAPPAPAPSSTTLTIFSMEEDEMSADQLACRDALRAGKRLLKERNGAAAMVRFEKALMLSKALGDKVQERRAVRGLAASTRLQGQYRVAIQHLERVLEISRQAGEYTGDADAYGTIADCYTDLGEFEKAAAYYDRYIDRMNRDGPV